MSELKIPVGISDFPAIRDNGFLYIDKTDLIFKLVHRPGSFFLTRPRRFGKSLLLSTIATLFAKGSGPFAGLKIESQWADHTYPVFTLDFAQITPFLEDPNFNQTFLLYVCNCLGVDLKGQSPLAVDLLKRLSDWFSQQRAFSIVLLIDEYDAPLIHSLKDEKQFTKVRDTLIGVFQLLKKYSYVFRFFLITGITRFHRIGFSSVLNHLTNITMEPEFGRLLGMTKEEIAHFCSLRLEEISSGLSINSHELMEALETRYDGFCFERTVTQRVFCPWSIMRYLNNPKNGMVTYWFDSANSPELLTSYFSKKILPPPENFLQEYPITESELSGSFDIGTIRSDALLTQLGYLTLKRKENKTFFLGYPNDEVRESMAATYSALLLRGNTPEGLGAARIVETLSQGDVNGVFESFNKIFNCIDYQNYPIGTEAAVRAFVQIFLIGAELEPQIEVHSALGRSDLEVLSGQLLWVFEFKLAKDASEVPVLIEEGKKQLVCRKYGLAQHRATGQIRLAAVFGLEERSFVAWQQVD